MMRKIGFALLALGTASIAQAVTFTSVVGAPDPGVSGDQQVLVDFETDPADGFSLSGDFAYGTGTVTNVAAAPAGDATRYLYVTSATPSSGIATLSTLDLSSVGFYWGSIDTFNSVDVLGAGGSVIYSIAGTSPFLVPADGNQGRANTNRRVTFTAEGDEIITGLRFRTTGVAFELDDISGTFADDGSGSVVPEPATWAMFVVGFGLVGASVRRRRRNVVAA